MVADFKIDMQTSVAFLYITNNGKFNGKSVLVTVMTKT